MIVNGKKRDIEPGTTIEELIQTMGLPKNIVVVKVDGKKIPKDKYHIELDDNNNIEIYSLIGGG
ncbi:sulfur carrier protein ThiS [Clostridium sp. Cult3]|uniref:sulfur carrier protein ThiS n=1 Tax=Clostridium sp. Cult3 TaxID=2079004 RepID=UPI001EFFFD3F|nr:thiamine biosynthesis protein ThiS [Clostridium sp. Cult3]